MPHTFFTLIRFTVQELGEADIGKAVIIKSTAISGTGLFITASRLPVASLFRQLLPVLDFTDYAVYQDLTYMMESGRRSDAS